MIGFKAIVNGIVDHNERCMSPGDYFLLFIMKRLSDPSSKEGIEKWIARDYASTLYERRGSQDFWNLMDRITDPHVDSAEIIDLHKKRNRVEHCFRTINSMGIAFPIYHRTPQKIRVHMFYFSKFREDCLIIYYIALFT